MKTIITLAIATILGMPAAWGGGSISWEDVRARISKSDPELVKVIEKTFEVNRSGGAVRLGRDFGERQGERIAPYEFGAKERKSAGPCVLVIEESEDYEFTGRFKFTKKPAEVKAATGQEGGAEPGKGE